MAKQASKKPGKTRKSKATVTETSLVRRIRPGRWLIRNLIRLALVIAAIFVVLVFLFAVVNPPVTHTMWVEYGRYGPLEREWVPLDDIAPVMARSVVAAEDANFCLHWGLDVDAIKSAMEDGGTRGGSTISQQVSKNVFLWQGRSYVRKAMETMITLMVELVWPKRRILEVYLNVAETGPGIFGVDAAARHYFDVSAADLTPMQAARIAAVLPSPRTRNPANLSPGQRRRAVSIADGAATIAVDGRAACFED